VSLLGRQLTLVAAPYQLYEITGSTLAVGLLGLAQFPALVIGSFFGGTLSDAFDRRKVLIVSQIIMALTSVGLAINAGLDSPTIWAIYALTSANAFFSGIDSPARSASIPRLVAHERLPAAFALNILMYQSGAAVGPAIAGVIIGSAGIAEAFWIDAGSFTVALVTLLLMRPLSPEQGGTRVGWSSVVEGLRFLRAREELKGVFLIDICAMVFGMPRALFPEFGLSVLGGTAQTVGLLYAAPGIGSVAAAFTSGWVGRILRPGRATVIAVLVWSAGIVGFGLSTSTWLAVTFLVIAGAGDAISAVFRQTVLQVTTPDRLRGRLSAVQIAVVAGGPRVGDAEAGVVAAAFGPRVSAWSGGIASAAGALLIGAIYPAFREWRDPRLEGETSPRRLE
jgi:MFS family permease